MSTLAEPRIVARQDVRMEQADARRILSRLEGSAVPDAHTALRFRAGLVSAPLARVLQQGIAEARRADLDPSELVIAGWAVTEGETITRLRRMAHGIADWISTETTAVTLELGTPSDPDRLQSASATTPPDGRTDEAAGVPGPVPDDILQSLRAVIDPDLGINIVDLGFVRGLDIQDGRAQLTLTLTNPFCPLTSVISDQVHHELVDAGAFDDVDITWVFDPPWKPEDISDSAREQLREIGFSWL